MFIFIFTISSFIIVQGPILYLLKIPSTSIKESLCIPIQQIGAVVAYDGKLTEDQKIKINAIMPIKKWGEFYAPGFADPIKNKKYFNAEVISNNKMDFIKLWLGICINNPKIVTKAYIDQIGIVWNIECKLNYGCLEIINNDFGIKQKTLNKTITNILMHHISLTQGNYLIYLLFWCPAFCLFLLIFLMKAFILRGNNKKYLLILVPLLFNNLSIIITCPAPHFRYLYCNVIISIFISLILLCNFKSLSK